MQSEHESSDSRRDLIALSSYLSARLDCPRRLERFALDLFAYLLTDRRLLMRGGALNAFRDAAAAVLQLRGADSSLTRDDPLLAASSTRLRLHLERALTELPPIHAALLRALELDGRDPAHAASMVGIEPAHVELFLTQTWAMLRTLEWEPPSMNVWGNDDQYLLLTAQHAAYWRFKLAAGDSGPPEFINWIHLRIAHVREMLLALAWREALDGLHQSAPVD